MNKPIVIVYISVYDAELTVSKTIDSIINPNFEIILSCNHYAENTIEIV